LQKVKYNLHTQELTVRVLPYEPQADYSEETEQLYDRFHTAGAKDYTKEFPFTTEMNHVEALILKGVATLFPELFQSLCDFHSSNQDFTDNIVLAFDREIQFYIGCLDYCDKIRTHGSTFCYPEVVSTAGSVYARETFDITLAHKLAEQDQAPVYNDFVLTGKERIIIVSGPNQGGKTTFARTFGQLHYLACLGCPVPGSEVQVMLFDAIYTHFEREEDIETHRSKFEEDLVRIHAIVEAGSERSIIILNEIFSSTTLQDALFLCRKIMQHLIRLNAYCVWVTFIDELVSLSDTAISMVSMVAPDHPATRTFKVIRKAPDGMAYALSIAEKYHITYDQLKDRITT
ncbi:MAG: MutS-related protein, partial [Ginsengibacter sp.]